MRIPKIVYNATTLTFTLPARAWVPGTVGVGAGIAWSAAGVPSAWVTRRDRTLSLTQRITESEWPTFRAFLDWAQAGGSFDWYPDASLSTKYTCYLTAPAINEDVRPVAGEFPGDLEVSYTIRRASGAAIDEEFYG